jgi:hypothetical protein
MTLDETGFATTGFVTFFGIFSAYWALTTNCNAWLWFFLGLLFAPITARVLQDKNFKDRSGTA